MANAKTDRAVANFALIGPGKSGTTALHALLSRHPEVRMASVKETCFFTDHHGRGVDWYHRLFPEDRGQRHVGEVSNTYVFSPEAACRMRDYNPAMRVVSCLRNPVERTFSHWLFLERNGANFGTLERAIEARPDLVERGMYARHLEHWLRAFPRPQVLLLSFDDFRSDPLAQYNALLRFLGASPVDAIELSDADRLPASRPRSRLVARVVKRVASAVRASGHPAIIQRIKESALPRLLYRAYGRGDRPELTPQQRASLGRRFVEDARKLGDLMGRDLVAEWKLGSP